MPYMFCDKSNVITATVSLIPIDCRRKKKKNEKKTKKRSKDPPSNDPVASEVIH